MDKKTQIKYNPGIIKRQYKDFNWKQYVANYKDLQDKKINDEKKALIHWASIGMQENRTYKPIITKDIVTDIAVEAENKKLLEVTNDTEHILETNKVAIIFVCYDKKTTIKCINRYPHAKILYVGYTELNFNNNNITIARNLPYNIEHYTLFLTFTAWYAIIKNNLFPEYEYLCILEYNVICQNLLSQLGNIINDNQLECISFFKQNQTNGFFQNISSYALKLYDVEVNNNIIWYPTTNHCLRRDILSGFVDWFYPKCVDEIVLKSELKLIPQYHEIFFTIYLDKFVSHKLCVELLSLDNKQKNNRVLDLSQKIVVVKHNAGFFSCCSVRLHEIIKMFNRHKHQPYYVDSSTQFELYKYNIDNDITHELFKTLPDSLTYVDRVDYCHRDQFELYTKLNYKLITPIVNKYFTLSDEVNELYNQIVIKYNIDFDNTCVLFYRGNDKHIEVGLPSISDYLKQAQYILDLHPNIRFLVQSDDTVFIDTITKTLSNTVVFKDEIRHIHDKNKTVDMIDKSTNLVFVKKYLAITYLMSKCKYLVFGSGNCSMWIVLYRGNSDNILQHNRRKWNSSIK